MSLINNLHTGAVASLLLLAELATGQAIVQAAGKDPLPLQTERTFSLTTDEGTWISLDVSPDGKQVVFDLLGHIYSMSIDGGEAKAITNGLGFDSQPRYSPDGTHIVFTSDRSGDDNVWVMKADGTNPIPITQEETALFTSPSWTWDGASILVSKKKPHHYSGAFELWQYSLNGGSGIQVIKSGSSEEIVGGLRLG